MAIEKIPGSCYYAYNLKNRYLVVVPEFQDFIKNYNVKITLKKDYKSVFEPISPKKAEFIFKIPEHMYKTTFRDNDLGEDFVIHIEDETVMSIFRKTF